MTALTDLEAAILDAETLYFTVERDICARGYLNPKTVRDSAGRYVLLDLYVAIINARIELIKAAAHDAPAS